MHLPPPLSNHPSTTVIYFAGEAAVYFGAIVGIAVPYNFVAAYNTIVSGVVSGNFSLFLRHVLLRTRICIKSVQWMDSRYLVFDSARQLRKVSGLLT
jgi:hypothetical protein